MSTLPVSNLTWPVQKLAVATIAFDSSYPTGGETLRAIDFGFATFRRLMAFPSGTAAGGAGYSYNFTYSSDFTTATILVYQTGSVTPAGTNTATTSADYANPVFSGTGQSSAGQVITTTDNIPSMLLNQCTGMWFVSATHGPYLIASNTAVTNAPGVLTIYGTAPTTDAGTYKILKSAAQTFAGTATTAGVMTELPNGTSLAAITALPIRAYGY